MCWRWYDMSRLETGLRTVVGVAPAGERVMSRIERRYRLTSLSVTARRSSVCYRDQTSLCVCARACVCVCEAGSRSIAHTHSLCVCVCACLGVWRPTHPHTHTHTHSLSRPLSRALLLQVPCVEEALLQWPWQNRTGRGPVSPACRK